MLRHYQPPNPLIMGADQLRSSLILRIEQADEKLLRVINSVVDAVIIEYVPELTMAEYEASLKPMTIEELTARAEASNEDIAAGRLIDLEDLKVEYSL